MFFLAEIWKLTVKSLLRTRSVNLLLGRWDKSEVGYINSQQNDFMCSGVWPNQTAPALRLCLAYLLHCPAWPRKPRKVWWKAVPSSLRSQRPDNDPPPPSVSAPGASRTKEAPVEAEPSCFTWITDLFPLLLFDTHMHTHPSSLSSDVELVSVWVGASACCSFSNIDAFPSPLQVNAAHKDTVASNSPKARQQYWKKKKKERKRIKSTLENSSNYLVKIGVKPLIFFHSLFAASEWMLSSANVNHTCINI